LVRGDDVKARMREVIDLMAPAVPKLWKAVQQRHQFAIRGPNFGGVKRQAVRLVL
jgi:hypothetical protein